MGTQIKLMSHVFTPTKQISSVRGTLSDMPIFFAKLQKVLKI